MRVIWEIADIKAGIKVKRPLEAGGFVNFIIANYFGGSGTVWGIFSTNSGEFIRVGNGSQEAVMIHLNNGGCKPLEE